MWDYAIHVAVLVAFYAILSVGLNIIVGYTGILSIGHAAFFGVGAYASALLSMRLGWPFPLCVAASLATGCALALAVGLPTMRVLRGDYLLVATLALCEVVRSVLKNWDALTGGSIGIMAIPPARVGWFTIDSAPKMLLLSGLVLATVVYVSERIHRTQLGRLLRAVRDDEDAAAGAGVNPLRLKIIAMLVGGGSAGVAGCLYAHYMAYIEPNTFGLGESLLIFGMVVVGGLGSTWGAIVGAAVLTTLPEILRFAGMTQTHAATLRQLVFGVLLIAIMALRPSGILGERAGRWRTE